MPSSTIWRSWGALTPLDGELVGGLRLTFEQIGVAEVEHELLGIEARAYNLEPALHLVLADMREAERELFETAGASSGEPWAELKESTLQRKAALGYPPNILIATSDLEASLTEEGGDNIGMVSESEVLFGTFDPKAHFHQSGTVKMPQRKVLDFSELRIRGWTKTVQRYIVGADRAAFGAGAR